ncbi:MFS transporter [Alkaliphilus pronyensis]|uniref:MFS transporter n=1 Tax=Alkaliphilus pronyensis TaxID=1482732 RepID=A0A6I0FBP9_9FIRM|nr:MFS transporter [Alkaliphilus pronyensis]KAB3529973.1 MFS transporter [Alkaliphilus pronyensis]
MNQLSTVKRPIYLISFPLSFIAFIMPVYAIELGASIFEVGILYSVFSLCGVLLRPLVGKWIDIRGRKNGVLVGLISYASVMVLLVLSDSYKLLFIANILQGIAGGFLWISLNTMVSDVSDDENRSKNFGDIVQVSNRGAMMGSIIAFSILFNISIDNPFKLIFMFYLLISIIAIYYGAKNTQETLQQSNQCKSNENAVDYTYSKFRRFLAIITVLSLVGSMLTPIFLIYMKEQITDSITMISYVYIPGAILSIFLPKKLGILSDTYGRKNLLIIGLLLQAIIVFLMPITKTYLLFMLVYTLLVVGGMLVEPAKRSLVTELTGNIQRGKSYGYYSTAVGLGGIIGPLIGTFVYQYFGHTLLFYIQGVTILVSSIIIYAVLRESSEKLHNLTKT